MDIDADSFEDLEVGILNTVDFLDLGTQVHRNLSRQTDHYGPAWVLTYRQFRNRPIQTLSDSVQRFIADGVDDAGGHLMLRPSMGTLSYRFDTPLMAYRDQIMHNEWRERTKHLSPPSAQKRARRPRNAGNGPPRRRIIL